MIPDVSADCGKVYFGIPKITHGMVLSNQDYVLSKDRAYYAKTLLPQEILSQETSRWEIRGRQFLWMGEEVLFQQISVIVTSVRIATEHGELIYSYELSRRDGIKQEKEENIQNQILYTGQQYDQVTGQYYLRARFYNPVVGRFLQEDEYRGGGLYQYPNGSVRNEDGKYVSFGEKKPSSKIVYQDKNGNIYKYGDPRFRPPYAPGQVEAVYESGRDKNTGKVISQPSKTEINADPKAGRKGIWGIGKKKIYNIL